MHSQGRRGWGCVQSFILLGFSIAALLGSAAVLLWLSLRPDSPLMAIIDKRLFAITMYNKRQDAYIAAQNAPIEAERWLQFQEVLFYGGLLFVGIFLIIGGRRLWLWANQPASVMRASNGMFPVMVRNVAPWYLRLLGRAQMVTINPNMALSPVSSHSFSTGRVTDVFMPPAHDDAEIVRLAITSNAQAQAQAGAQATGGRINVRQSFNNGYGGRQPVPKALPAPPPPITTAPVERRVLMSASEAVNKAKNGRIPLGVIHTPQRGQDPYAVWDANEASQIGVFGANGTGKTRSVAMMAVLLGIRWYWHVVILDPKRGADWRSLEPYVERVDSGPDEMPGQLTVICNEIDRRAALCAKHSVGTIQDLPDAIRPQIMLLVIEEMGDTRAQLAPLKKGKLLETFDAQFSKIMRISRYVGIKVLLIDQRPENWPPATKANLKAIITFKQGMHQGNAVGYYGAHLLANKGQFAFEGTVYDAYHAYTILGEFLDVATKQHKQKPKSGHFLTWKGHQVPRLLAPGISTTSAYEDPVDSIMVPVQFAAGMPSMDELDTRTKEEGPEDPEEEFDTRSFEDYEDEQGRVIAYLEATPNATQADLRRKFKFSNNKAHRLWHRYRGQSETEAE